MSHIDCFNDVLTMFMCLDHGSTLACLWSVRELLDFIKNILICVPKMKEGLRGLERYEGE